MVKDPLEGLSAWEKRQLILQPPTWSERWRLCEPFLSREQREDLVRTILSERRETYERAFMQQLARAERLRAEIRYAEQTVHLTEFKLLATTAMKGAHRARTSDRYESDYKQLVLDRREDRARGYDLSR